MTTPSSQSEGQSGAGSVRRYVAMVCTNMTFDGVALADPEPMVVVLAADYDALAAKVVTLTQQLAIARASNQDAADLLIALNKNMHARNPGAVTAIDVWLAERALPPHAASSASEKV